MFIFPGLGLGAVLCEAHRVTGHMLQASSLALADSLTGEERASGAVFPSVRRIREVSASVAAAVALEAAPAAPMVQAPEAKAPDAPEAVPIAVPKVLEVSAAHEVAKELIRHSSHMGLVTGTRRAARARPRLLAPAPAPPTSAAPLPGCDSANPAGC